MRYSQLSISHICRFLNEARLSFKNVLLMHGFILFVFFPLLSSCTRIILKHSKIPYLSYDLLPSIITDHPFALFFLTLLLIVVVLAAFFEFTFLLLTVFFIKKKQPITVLQLIHGTLLQIKKIRPLTFLFFLFYFFLILPISYINFHSDVLAKIKIPAFILDFIFANRVILISIYILYYLVITYLGIRLIFALPQLILVRSISFCQSLKISWKKTRHQTWRLVIQMLAIWLFIILLLLIASLLIFLGQWFVEQFFSSYAFISAVIAMTLLQCLFLLNIVLSSLSILYIIIENMSVNQLLPDLPEWFSVKKKKKFSYTRKGKSLLLIMTFLFSIGVVIYNANYLRSASKIYPLAISHRGVNGTNGVQNTLPALISTSKAKPNYVEMDIYETKDKQFVVMHDFDLDQLAGIKKRVNQLTLKELQALTVKENGKTASICSFDDYLKTAKNLNQKLIIEIKTTKQDTSDVIDLFIKKYRTIILKEHHFIHTLTYETAIQLKQKEPRFYVGYIVPFNVVGPPIGPVDFFSMEYSTLNRNFINAAHEDGKKVFAWTVNDKAGMKRLMFYGVDGIMTDELTILKKTMQTDLKHPTYSDKLFNFVIGIN
ncbi:glycerophosphoryl diester phosphodiesterase membrane domain-containing protein [Melissococcus plutonius]|uniref:glycerophosphoryl diester phosphodiesterase membrane domain-containing protein n=1 Tax=Melissococcus plutonius TaxID=33970 RepID=UPI00065DE09B|nr:glycerophosphodiester phosphodiesterase [Melissococcus plutonius]AKQ32803.1 glycerophosphoryl diester phosphodiesterase [Melissococcus plutonius S1]KMT25113.1 glycerophosphoryl diester phosphodiesterase [Melissococcus plutonius]KMT26750.1 glycerophosphoryl diester phosphodiesterase [Melissococcus plutonius]KMT28000.1 glycerophosphoryl diester phosphodiesterase [Melissococcus plutonius]KMT29773.1 glycerophosphoryl diester phosphodiesterase [Melissococcus plutonius]